MWKEETNISPYIKPILNITERCKAKYSELGIPKVTELKDVNYRNILELGTVTKYF